MTFIVAKINIKKGIVILIKKVYNNIEKRREKKWRENLNL